MPSVNNEILELLQSKKEEEQIKGLQILGAERNVKPSPLVIKHAIQLLNNGTSYVKETAIFAIGIHWACDEAYPIIKAILKSQIEDEDVLVMAAQSLPRYKNREIFNANMVLSILADIVLEEANSNDLRGVSYVSMLDIENEIKDKKTLAKMPDELDKLNVDWAWVEKFKNKT